MEFSVAQPIWLILIPIVFVFLSLVPIKGGLPGSWVRQIDKRLARFLELGVVGRPRHNRKLMLLALWLLLSASLSTISLGKHESPVMRNLHARVVVVDMGASTGVQNLIANVRRFIASDDDTPIGLVAVTSQAFEIVPLTTDYSFLERYLRVLDFDALPVRGRNPLAGIEAAELMLQRAQILAGQIVFFAGDGTPKLDSAVDTEISSDLWLVVDAQSSLHSWQETAVLSGAKMILASQTSQAIASLDKRAHSVLADAVSIRERREITPWLLMMCLPLWMAIYFRRQVA